MIAKKGYSPTEGNLVENGVGEKLQNGGYGKGGKKARFYHPF